MKKATQQDDILYYLKSHKKGLTSKEAFDKFGATRLSGVVYNLKKKGYVIDSVNMKVKNRYGSVSMITRYVYGASEDGSN